MPPTFRYTRAGTLALVLFFAKGPLLRAQDTRNVSEPKFPPACTVLNAQLSISNNEPTSETAFDTSRIQTALNHCPSGQAVELAPSEANYAFLIKPITIPSGVTLLVDAGATVFASRNPADYQTSNPTRCGSVTSAGGGCQPLISSKGTTGSGLMGYGIIDGRGWDNLIVNGTVQNYSWYSNTLKAYIPRPVLNQSNFDLINLSQASNFTFYKITLKDSPEFNIHWYGKNGGAVTRGLTIWGIKIISPNNISNTDGIDPTDNSSDITIADSYISNGDDHVAISSTADGNPVTNVSITNLHTYAGFGISIGSRTQGGISNVQVDKVVQSGWYPNHADAGLKIKSSSDRGGVVSNVLYQHVCQQNEGAAIRIYPWYTHPSDTSHIPTFKNITLRDITILANSDGGSGNFTFQGFDANHPTTITLDNLNVMGKPNTSAEKPTNVDITMGPGPVNPGSLQQLSGTGVSYTGQPTNTSEAPYPCTSASFQQITGELSLSTASSANLHTLAIASPATFTLNVVVQPAAEEYPALSKPITFYDGDTAVGTAAIGGNGTLATLTLSKVAAGTHTYTAQYPADSNYPAFTFGSILVNVTGDTTSPTPPPTPTPTPTNPSFTVAASPSSLLISSGSSGITSLTITPAGGFTGTPAVTCTNPMPSITCTITQPAAVSGTAPTTANVSIAVANTSTTGAIEIQHRIAVAAVLPFGAFLLLPLASGRRRWLLWMIAFAGIALSVTGCSTPTGTAAGAAPVTTQVVTLTTTANGIKVATPISVTIN